MTSDVVLSAALRSNLLSLQGTQSLIDTTQFRLSTGKKVNSALDNPQSFFASQALTNRASDLTRLLDGIGQSIQVIKAADNGVTALTSLVNQAQALAESAQSAVTTGSAEASATGTIALSGGTLLNTLTGFAASGDQIAITITDPTTGALTIDGTVAIGTAKGGLITTGTNWTVNDLVDEINNINSRAGTGGNAPLSTPAVEASLDSSGHLQIKSLTGGTMRVRFISATAGATAATTVATSLGFGSIAKTNQNGATANTTDTVDFTVRASASITSNKLYSAVGTLAVRSTLVTDLLDSAGVALTTNTLAAADTLRIKVGGKTSGDLLHYQPTGAAASFTAATTTVGALVDAINNDSTINTLVRASFDDSTGQISITALDPTAVDVQFRFGGASGESISTATTAYPTGLGFGTQALTTAAQTLAQETVRFGAAAGELASLATQYDSIREQIDALVTNGDTGYRGTNLLNGDDLLTTFNEDRTSSLTTNGQTFTSSSLGIDAASFGNAASIEGAIDDLNDALAALRDFGSTLASDLSVIQTRQTFTNNLINTLKAGSDLLTVADQNEEGAKLLALQTRQQLGVTALSLASQSQQSILRLF